MSRQPALLIIARHGPRLDAADQSWHLSTPTPYDPPLTYAGWNQSRSLGTRIASLLHAREQSINTDDAKDGVTSHDFAQNNDGEHKDNGGEEPPKKRRRVRHKVVIHSSPFLRCLQTSVAIAAGMAQYNPSIETGKKQSAIPKRMQSASPRIRTPEGHGSPNLTAISEPDHEFAHALARKALHDRKRHRKSKLRVDAFLGEWLNPQYFEGITSPPPSAMMVTTAKAELLENESIEIFTPTVQPKQPASSSGNSLWGGATESRTDSHEDALEDWDDVQDSLQVPLSPAKQSRSSSHSLGYAPDANRKSKQPDLIHPVPSSIPKPEISIYNPPVPQYAVSGSSHIPRGYVVHARNACTNVDYQWDSSRSPQSWGDGGEYGEEWSSMHKRFRRGLNRMIHWYSQHDADNRSEDSLGFDQAQRQVDEEVEDLVVIMVTHGAGCNALIGALTGQPVLMDIGMASLTMAVRKDDAPSVTTHASSTASNEDETSRESTNGHPRRGSVDMGLSALYEMKLISSTEHLRPSPDMARASSQSRRAERDSMSKFKEKREEPTRANTNSALGTIRRPSAMSIALTSDPAPRSSSLPRNNLAPPTPPMSSGLWTPPAAKTPLMQPQHQTLLKEDQGLFSSQNERGRQPAPGDDMMLDFSTSPPDSRPTSSNGAIDAGKAPPADIGLLQGQLDGADERSEQTGSRPTEDNPKAEDDRPRSLNRGLSQKGLWGSIPSGSKVERRGKETPKRRWTVYDD